jgi:hypothetical protein
MVRQAAIFYNQVCYKNTSFLVAMKVKAFLLALVLESTTAFTVSIVPVSGLNQIRSHHFKPIFASVEPPIKEDPAMQKKDEYNQIELESTDSTEKMSETQKLMKQVKDAGVAGIISYALWELGFWAVSVPVVIFGYVSLTGHMPDINNKEDMAKLGAEAFAFVNFARFAVPLRIGLALSTTGWIQQNVVDRFNNREINKPAENTMSDE